MKLTELLNRFFSERSFPLYLKAAVFCTTAFIVAALYILISKDILHPQEGRLLLHVLYLFIFVNAFFGGFLPGLAAALASGHLAVLILIPETVPRELYGIAEMEVFPFIAMYFMVAITVDWFRGNIERLRLQLTENDRLHAHARHMEKLALAGEIAAGIAHEIRNPLTVVQGYIQLLAQDCQTARESDVYKTVIGEIRRSNQIIAEFLRFSRPEAPQKNPGSLNDMLDTAISLIYGEATRKNVKVFFFPGPDLPETLFDRDQMLQVFLNLFTNAVQAMPDGGTLSVYSTFEPKSGNVTLSVSDSGTGISAEVLEKIFTPFFTTKEEGTGLGLAISQTIVEAHNGTIKVESAPGQGTRFVITLPLSEKKPGESHKK